MNATPQTDTFVITCMGAGVHGNITAMRRRWMGLEWIDKFGLCVIIGFLAMISGLVACTALNEDQPGPTLPRLPFPTIVVTAPVPPTTILDCGPHVRASDCANGPGILGLIIGVHRSTGHTAASAGMLGP